METTSSTASAQEHDAILAALAGSAPAPAAMAALYAAVAGGSLDERTRRRIGLALAGLHQCAHGLAVHMAGARRCGLTGDEISRNLRGDSEDARAALAVGFACALARRGGSVDDTQLVALRAAGYEHAQLIDIVMLVGVGVLESMVAHAVRLPP
jgi:AhpD family alkylhydroperoxidase